MTPFVNLERLDLNAETKRIERLIRSVRRARVILILLALLLPIPLYCLFERQARSLDALADHGEMTEALVTSESRSNEVTYIGYTFTVKGSAYTWNVGQDEAPYPAGSSFTITYLPEDPSFSRPGHDRDAIRAEAAKGRRFEGYSTLGIWGFFGLIVGINEWKLRKLRAGESARPRPIVVARITALLLLATMIGTNFSADVAAVDVKAFGAKPFGLPVMWVVSICEVILFIPFFWVTDHLMRFIHQALRDGASISKLGILIYMLRAPQTHPELKSSRLVVLGGLAYFALILAGWIAYTARLGI